MRKLILVTSLLLAVHIALLFTRRSAKAEGKETSPVRIGIVLDVGGRGDKSFNDGAYAGAFGWIAADGRADLGVVIRSLMTAGDGRYRLGSGGAITVLSDVAEEYDESRWKAERLLRGALEMQTSDCEPRGCMRVISSVSCSPEAESIRAELMERRRSSQKALCDRMQRARDEGDLSPDVDVEGLCNYLGAILQGMSVQAGSGATKEQLQSLVETSLAMWPGK